MSKLFNTDIWLINLIIKMLECLLSLLIINYLAHHHIFMRLNWILHKEARIYKGIVVILTTAAKRTNQSHWPTVILRARSCTAAVPIFSRGKCVGVAENSVAWRHRAGVDRRSVVRDRSQLLNWFFDPHNVTNAWPRLPLREYGKPM